ncbi:MAG: hypothetical protein JRM98_03445 [Nitrososphaerota archaeon]|jgi:hypothetical protein|nr:hypothetical protein [Nitrososphaerota archaeon]
MKKLIIVAVLVIIILSSSFIYFSRPQDPYKVTLKYAYVTNDLMSGTAINYTEYWSYQLLGINGGVMHVIAYKTLRTYVIVINESNGFVLGAYYLSSPHYNITFSGSSYYEPIILFRHYRVGDTVLLLNDLPFTVISVKNGREVLAYSNRTAMNGSVITEHYSFVYSLRTGYLENGTTLWVYEQGGTSMILYNQNILIGTEG